MRISGIRERMEVYAGDRQVGVVDSIEDGGIKLTRDDSPDGRHHTIPIEWVRGVEGNTVMLDKDADSVMAEWGDDSPVGVDAMLEDTMGSAAPSMGGGSAPSMGGDDMGGSSMGGNDMGSGFESSSTSSDDDDEDEQDGNIPRM